jgi:hypothetical protein
LTELAQTFDFLAKFLMPRLDAFPTAGRKLIDHLVETSTHLTSPSFPPSDRSWRAKTPIRFCDELSMEPLLASARFVSRNQPTAPDEKHTAFDRRQHIRCPFRAADDGVTFADQLLPRPAAAACDP